jgi:hypothetical protein
MRHATPQMTLGVDGPIREERLHYVVEQVTTILQGKTQRADSVYRRVDRKHKVPVQLVQTKCL